MKFTMRVGGTRALDALVGRLQRAAAGGLQHDLDDAVRSVAPAALLRVRSAWYSVEVSSTGRGGKSSGLRRRVAAATQARPIPGGVRIEVAGAAVDPRYGDSLARSLDGRGPWRHPVFGHDVTVTQHGQRVFDQAAGSCEPWWQARLERVVDRTAREIEG